MSEISQGGSAEARERDRVSAPEVSWALREVNRLAGELDGELARRLHLRPIDSLALGHVMTSGSPLGPAELSTRLGISTGSGTELVDRLERAGHLVRHRDSLDRRRVRLEATETAFESVLGELAPLFAAVDSVADGFTPEEQTVVIRYLRAAAVQMHAFIHEVTPGATPRP